MNAYILLCIEFLASFAASLAVLHVLARPLANVLERICPDEQAAAFWLSYARMMLIIAPLLLTLSANIVAQSAEPMNSLRLALWAVLGGLLIGLRMLGKQLGRFIATPRRTGDAP